MNKRFKKIVKSVLSLFVAGFIFVFSLPVNAFIVNGAQVSVNVGFTMNPENAH